MKAYAVKLFKKSVSWKEYVSYFNLIRNIPLNDIFVKFTFGKLHHVNIVIFRYRWTNLLVNLALIDLALILFYQFQLMWAVIPCHIVIRPTTFTRVQPFSQKRIEDHVFENYARIIASSYQ